MGTMDRRGVTKNINGTYGGYRLYTRVVISWSPVSDDLLFDTIEDHQNQCSKTTIHNWLAVNETTFIQSAQNVTKRALQGVRSIKSYFQTRRKAGSVRSKQPRP
jgi:hypothetical protein